MKAADGFNILLADDLVSLNPQSHCKFRSVISPKIILILGDYWVLFHVAWQDGLVNNYRNCSMGYVSLLKWKIDYFGSRSFIMNSVYIVYIILTMVMFVIPRFLYKQRCFQMSVPKLVLGYREAKSETAKANFIQALSSQLKHIPKEILAMEIENVRDF